MNFANTDIDTDQIIPARFLTTTTREGLGQHLFHDWRYLPDGSSNQEFILNKPDSAGCKILVAGRNFGCGSSREHAPFALQKAGVKIVIAEAYARIFYRNSVDGGFLVPIVTARKINKEISTNDNLEINLETNVLKNLTTGKQYKLEPLGNVLPIVEAGGLFEYARKTGMIKQNLEKIK